VTPLYVCDLDGTLLGPDARPSAFTRETFNGLVADGVAITIATARSLVSLRRVTEGLDLRGPAVVYGGAFVVDLVTGATLVERVLDPALVDRVLGVLARLDVAPLVYSVDAVEGTHADTVGWVAGSESPGLAWYLGDRGHDPRFRPVGHARELRRDGTFSVVAIAPEAELRPIAELLRREFAGEVAVSLQEETYLPGTFWLELAAPGATKGDGIADLRRLTGADRVICFGDNRNDLAMFAAADESYAVANASAEVRGRATGVIGSNAVDGVAHWLVDHARVSTPR
jgi:Cof subfamily protein (haloacid dehalogenase superfamily)